MAFNKFKNIPLIGSFLNSVARNRVNIKVQQIIKNLHHESKVLDVGCGNGLLCKGLMDACYDVTPVDIQNNSFLAEVKPILYDGETLPFDDNQFDTVLLVTVLHHARFPERLLSEGARVATKLIVIEEVFSSLPGKYWAFFIDSLFNFEFRGHPHTNKTNLQWLRVFAEMDLTVTVNEHSSTFPWLRRVLYVAIKSELSGRTRSL